MMLAHDIVSKKEDEDTVEPLNNGHIGGRDFVPCREVVHYRRLNNTTAICLVPSYVSIIGRLSLARRVLYRRFHCIERQYNSLLKCIGVRYMVWFVK